MTILMHAAHFEAMRPLALALARRGHTLALISGSEPADTAAALQLEIESADGMSLAAAAPADEAAREYCASLLTSAYGKIDAAFALGENAPNLAALWEMLPRKNRPEHMLQWELFETDEAVESGLQALGW